jgi:nucleoside-diphosphate-sugar epimerase
VLVTGATGRVGRCVIDLLTDAGAPVRALVRRSESAATLPATVEVVTGDLTVPRSLDAALHAFLEKRELKPAQLIHALRVASTGKGVGVGMFDALEILGKDRATKRIRRALELARQ